MPVRLIIGDLEKMREKSRAWLNDMVQNNGVSKRKHPFPRHQATAPSSGQDYAVHQEVPVSTLFRPLSWISIAFLELRIISRKLFTVWG